MNGVVSQRSVLSSTADDGAAHWDERARLAYVHRGERIYTITPVPFYLARRALLLRVMDEYLPARGRVCDYGCGDGWYLRHFSANRPELAFTGVDVSAEMLRQSAEKVPGATLHLAAEDWGGDFDLIYCLAVLAHVDDQLLGDILRSWHGRLRPGGRVLIFEQVGAFPTRGPTYVRRTAAEYLQAFQAQGFEPESARRISFDVHRWFERFIAKPMYARCYAGENDTTRRLAANRSAMFRTLSRLAVALSPFPLRRNLQGFGNAVMVFRKKGVAQ